VQCRANRLSLLIKGRRHFVGIPLINFDNTIMIKEFQKTPTGDFESQIAQQALILFFPNFVQTFSLS
jgi:hypothetical protein